MQLNYKERPPGPPTDLCFYAKRDDLGVRSHHVHIVESSAEEDRRLLLRDFLRAHPSHAEKYEKLKRDLAVKFRCDRDAYIDGKTSFLSSLLVLALEWKMKFARRS